MSEPYKVICYKCAATGSLKRPFEQVCPFCKGRGYIELYGNKGELKKKKNDESREKAFRGGKRYGEYELMILKDTSISISKAAKILGRSRKSVESRRHRMKKEAKQNES